MMRCETSKGGPLPVRRSALMFGAVSPVPKMVFPPSPAPLSPAGSAASVNRSGAVSPAGSVTPVNRSGAALVASPSHDEEGLGPSLF